jgi:hypothetical protein
LVGRAEIVGLTSDGAEGIPATIRSGRTTAHPHAEQKSKSERAGGRDERERKGMEEKKRKGKEREGVKEEGRGGSRDRSAQHPAPSTARDGGGHEEHCWGG